MLRHSDHREFLCANCGKQFKRKDKLKEHMQRMHAPDREAKLAGNSHDPNLRFCVAIQVYQTFIKQQNRQQNKPNNRTNTIRSLFRKYRLLTIIVLYTNATLAF